MSERGSRGPNAAAPSATTDMDTAETDTASPESCVRALYEVISGPAGAPRDWARFRSLCRPDAAFILAASIGPAGAPVTERWDVEAFVATGVQEFAAAGLFEREIARRVERFGRIAHVFSTFETRRDGPDAPVAVRGINSVQLVREGDAWRIAHLVWDVERAPNVLPPEYL